MSKKIYMTKKQWYVLSFIIPFAVLVSCAIGLEVEPFGDKSFIIIDGLHQYMPFYSVLYDKLKSGESLFYTFRTGLGINFLSLFSYYLSSPFNLLIIFFKKTQLNMVVSWIMMLKIALSGLAASVYFGRKTKEGTPLMLVAACTYALNSYVVGYSWNIMWLDVIMIFPIIMLGLERLVENGDGRVYCLSLFYALFCNYYIAFMVCIFSVLWFLQSQFSSIKRFFLRGISFAFYSLLAAGLAAVILIPAYLGIKQTASGTDMSLPVHSWLTDFTDILTRQFALIEPISHDNFDGNGNLYFGIFSIFSIFLYALNEEISWLEKAKKIVLVLLLIISCNEEVLNFIWHGFHNQYGIPNRFSFLLGFVLIYMLYESLSHFEGITFWQPIVAGVIPGGFLWISAKYAGRPLDNKVEYLTAGFLLGVYTLIILLALWRRKHKNGLLALFSIVAICEMCVTAILGYQNVGQITVSKFFSQVEMMEKATEIVDDGTFYRSELADGKIVDESTLYPMNAISLFGSTAKANVVNIMDSLGFFTGCNEYLYEGPSPISNLLFGVKYQYFRSSDYLKTEFQYMQDYKDIDIYENPVENLSIGYLMDPQIDEWNYKSAYPFRVMSELCDYGWNTRNILKNIPISMPQTNGAGVEQTNVGEYHFRFEKKERDNIVFSVPCEESTPNLLFHYDGTQVEKVSVYIDGNYAKEGDVDGQVINLGEVSAGSVIKITMALKGEEKSGYLRVSLAALDQKKFDEMAKNVTENSLKVTSHGSNHIEGTVNARKEQYLFFSIPYDEGWNVKVDGKSVETRAIGDAFLSVIIPEGQHEVSLTFVPPGYRVGWKVSLASLILFALLCVFYKKIKLKREVFELEKVENLKGVNENDEEENDSTIDNVDGDSDFDGEL